MRSSTIGLAVFIALLSGTPSFAQDLALVPELRQQQDPQKPQDPKTDPQKPPAAVGEAAAKPTRGFVSALFHNLGDDIKHLPRQNSVYWLAGGGAAALAIHPLDDNINDHFAGTGAADAFWKPGQVIGNTGVLLAAGATTYLVGRARQNQRVQHLGMDELEAQILTAGIVYGLKESVRRERPERAETKQASGFSFPSGHAASTFAAATVLQQHLGYRAGVPTYLIASYVAMSRLHENVHNASDVVFGATIGIVVGRSVTWHGRNFYASPMLIPKGSGIIVTVHAARPVRHS